MKRNRGLLTLLWVLLITCALSHSSFAQNVQTTDERITPATGDRICVATQQSGSDVGAKVNNCDSSLGSAKGEIWLTGGGTISTQISISSNHTLRVLSGTYAATTTAQVILLHDNTTLRCDSWSPILQETTGSGGSGVFTIVEDSASAGTNGSAAANIHVTGCHFKGARSDYNSAPQTISMGNCKNCSVTNNWLEDTHTIGIQVGGGNMLDNFAQNVRIADNLLTGVASQNIAVVNSKDVLVSHNMIVKPGQDNSGAPGLVPIDIEPNGEDITDPMHPHRDVLSNVKIIDNVINTTESTLAAGGTKVLHGIAIQNTVGVPEFGPVLVENNTIVGTKLSNSLSASQISGACILFNAAQNAHVRGNHMMRCADGIKDIGGSSRLTVENNTIQSAGFTGNTSMLFVSTTDSIIRGNLLYSDPASTSTIRAGEDTEIVEDGSSDNNIFEGNFGDGGVTLVGTHSKVISHSSTSGVVPTISSFVNSTHNHTNAAGGGQLGEGALSLSNVTTNDVSTTKHGFAPRAPNDVTKFLRGDGTWAVPSTGTPSGWTDSGTTVSLTTSTDSVGIGTSSPGSPLDVQSAFTTTNGAGVRFQQTLTAGNNNAVLNGLFINPTFNDGLAVGITHNALVTGSGHIGFGTSSTNAGLDVQVQPVPNTSSNFTYGTRLQQTLVSSGNSGTSTALFINPSFSDGFATGVKHNGLVVTDGNVGFGTSSPGSKLQVTSGDVYVDTVGNGLIIKSPNGTCFRLAVSNAGVLSASSITCP